MPPESLPADAAVSARRLASVKSSPRPRFASTGFRAVGGDGLGKASAARPRGRPCAQSHRARPLSRPPKKKPRRNGA